MAHMKNVSGKPLVVISVTGEAYCLRPGDTIETHETKPGLQRVAAPRAKRVIPVEPVSPPEEFVVSEIAAAVVESGKPSPASEVDSDPASGYSHKRGRRK